MAPAQDLVSACNLLVTCSGQVENEPLKNHMQQAIGAREEGTWPGGRDLPPHPPAPAHTAPSLLQTDLSWRTDYDYDRSGHVQKGKPARRK